MFRGQPLMIWDMKEIEEKNIFEALLGEKIIYGRGFRGKNLFQPPPLFPRSLRDHVKSSTSPKKGNYCERGEGGLEAMPYFFD